METLYKEFRILFWRSAAYLTGFAVSNRKLVHRTLTYAPIAIGGAIAYLIGRLIGEILLWGLA